MNSRKELRRVLLETVPREHRKNGIEYPLNELACVKYLSERGFRFKIGPEKEKAYDSVMEELGFDMEFAYLRPCYAFGTGKEVVPYSSSSGGVGGTRIYFSDLEFPRKVRAKLMMGPEDVCKYFCRLGSLAGKILWLARLHPGFGGDRFHAWKENEKKGPGARF